MVQVWCNRMTTLAKIRCFDAVFAVLFSFGAVISASGNLWWCVAFFCLGTVIAVQRAVWRKA